MHRSPASPIEGERGSLHRRVPGFAARPGLLVNPGLLATDLGSMRSSFLLSLVMALVLATHACVTLDRFGNLVEDTPPVKEPGKRQLHELPVQPAWTPEDRKIPIVLAGLPADPPAVFIVPNLPPPGNQGGQPSGTAWAGGYVAMTVLARGRGARGYVCSPSFVYNQLTSNNSGLEIHEALRLLSESGCASLALMPYNEHDYTTRPSPMAISEARAYRAGGFARVDFTDLNQLRAHLLQGSVVIATISITKNFLALEDSLWPGPEGFFVGRHTIAIVGYDDKAREFLLQNSAGREWGDKGYARISYDWLLRVAGTAYVLF